MRPRGGRGGCGTIFKITLQGALTTLYSFCSQPNCADGYDPMAGLVQGTDGKLYGTTYSGGANGLGSIFSVTTAGVLTTLYSFCAQTGCADGVAPGAALIQATDGNFYGTTFGRYGNPAPGQDGSIFRLSMGLAPFVKTLEASGRPGAPVTILGNNLTGATSVTFNGTPASCTVNSTGSAITTTVPRGASTGSIQAKLANGSVLTSNVAFRVP